jgi:hypothetical protein
MWALVVLFMPLRGVLPLPGTRPTLVECSERCQRVATMLVGGSPC